MAARRARATVPAGGGAAAGVAAGTGALLAVRLLLDAPAGYAPPGSHAETWSDVFASCSSSPACMMCTRARLAVRHILNTPQQCCWLHVI